MFTNHEIVQSFAGILRIDANRGNFFVLNAAAHSSPSCNVVRTCYYSIDWKGSRL